MIIGKNCCNDCGEKLPTNEDIGYPDEVNDDLVRYTEFTDGSVLPICEDCFADIPTPSQVLSEIRVYNTFYGTD
jgi:hypothetical protein